MNAPIRIGILDDHPIFRSGLRRLLERNVDMTVEWELAEATELDMAFTRSPVDLVLMDIEFQEGENGLDATRAALTRWPDLIVIILSGSLSPDTRDRALAHGAAGYLGKDAPIPEMISRIRELASSGRRRRSRARGDSVRLSARERQVLVHIRAGRTNREMAAALGISISTVNKHVQRVLKKLNVRNRTQAAAGQGEILQDEPARGRTGG